MLFNAAFSVCVCVFVCVCAEPEIMGQAVLTKYLNKS